MHHADPSGVYQSPQRLVKEHDTTLAFMHHDDQGHNALKHYTTLIKGLRIQLTTPYYYRSTSAVPWYIVVTSLLSRTWYGSPF